MTMPNFARIMLLALLCSAALPTPPAEARRKAEPTIQTASLNRDQLLALGSEALQRDDARGAAGLFAELAAREPRNGTAHTGV